MAAELQTLVLRPGDTITLPEIHALLPDCTILDGDTLIIREAIRFQRAPKPKPQVHLPLSFPKP